MGELETRLTNKQPASIIFASFRKRDLSIKFKQSSGTLALSVLEKFTTSFYTKTLDYLAKVGYVRTHNSC